MSKCVLYIQYELQYFELFEGDKHTNIRKSIHIEQTIEVISIRQDSIKSFAKCKMTTVLGINGQIYGAKHEVSNT